MNSKKAAGVAPIEQNIMYSLKEDNSSILEEDPSPTLNTVYAKSKTSPALAR